MARDTPLDVAMSMQAHNHFRLRAFKHHGLTTADGIRWSDLDERDLTNDMPMSPNPVTAVAAINVSIILFLFSF